LSSIKIDINGVQHSIPKLHTSSSSISNLDRDVRGLISSIDGRIQGRRGISGRLHNASRSMVELEHQISMLQRVIQSSMERYSSVEGMLAKKAGTLRFAEAKTNTSEGMKKAYKAFHIFSDWKSILNGYLEGLLASISTKWQNAVNLDGPAWKHTNARINGILASLSLSIEAGWKSSSKYVNDRWYDARDLAGAAWLDASNTLDDFWADTEAEWKRTTNSITKDWNDAVDWTARTWNSGVNYFEKKQDQMIETFDFVKRNKHEVFDVVLENTVRETLDITPIGRTIREKYEYAHYEKRDAMNDSLPTYKDVTRRNSEWILLPEEQSIFHDNHQGKPEQKFIHPDGREAVYDGDSLELIDEARYKGTYNYINPTIAPEGFPNSKEDLLNWVEYGATGLGHVVTDVVPYYLVGEKNERDQQREFK
jgi:hypothetical protein